MAWVVRNGGAEMVIKMVPDSVIRGLQAGWWQPSGQYDLTNTIILVSLPVCARHCTCIHSLLRAFSNSILNILYVRSTVLEAEDPTGNRTDGKLYLPVIFPLRGRGKGRQ